MLSEEHAEPEWTATPARSNPISTGSASTPCTPRHNSEGNRCSGSSGADDLDAFDLGGGRRQGGDVRAGTFRLEMEQATAVGAQRLRRRAEPHQGRYGFEPAASRPLLLAADDEGLEPAPATDDECAGAGEPPDFVGAQADEVGAQIGQVQRNVPARRRRVDVHRHAGVPAQADDLAHRLQCPHLMVGPLAVDERRTREGLRRQPGTERAGVDAGRRVDGNDLDGRQPGRCLAHRGVLDVGEEAPEHPGAGGSRPRRLR